MYLATTVAHHDKLDLAKSLITVDDTFTDDRRVNISLSAHRSGSLYSSSILHAQLTADEARWLMDGLAAALLAPTIQQVEQAEVAEAAAETLEA